MIISWHCSIHFITTWIYLNYECILLSVSWPRPRDETLSCPGRWQFLAAPLLLLTLTASRPPALSGWELSSGLCRVWPLTSPPDWTGSAPPGCNAMLILLKRSTMTFLNWIFLHLHWHCNDAIFSISTQCTFLTKKCNRCINMNSYNCCNFFSGILGWGKLVRNIHIALLYDNILYFCIS